jgi:lysozyme
MGFKQESKWYYDREDGTRIKNDWVQDQGRWYFIGDDSLMQTGWIKWKDKWYYLNPNQTKDSLIYGQMMTGWLSENGKWYYLSPNDSISGVSEGEMLTGWLQWNNEWYYLNPSEYDPQTGLIQGQMLASTTQTINGKSYSFDDKGAMENESSTVLEGSYISEDCLDFVKGWEGFTNNGRKYYDCVGVLTQGYGMTGDEIANLPDQIDEPTAASMLRTLINNKYAAAIKNNLDSKGITLTQNQFDALVIFAYNCGTPGLFGSTLYKNVCSGIRDTDTIYDDFMMWNKGEVDGKMQAIAGLTKRRSAEANIFNNRDYSLRP